MRGHYICNYLSWPFCTHSVDGDLSNTFYMASVTLSRGLLNWNYCYKVPCSTQQLFILTCTSPLQYINLTSHYSKLGYKIKKKPPAGQTWLLVCFHCHFGDSQMFHSVPTILWLTQVESEMMLKDRCQPRQRWEEYSHSHSHWPDFLEIGGKQNIDNCFLSTWQNRKQTNTAEFSLVISSVSWYLICFFVYIFSRLFGYSV